MADSDKPVGFTPEGARRIAEATKAFEASIRNRPPQRARAPVIARQVICEQLYIRTATRDGSELVLPWKDPCTGETGEDRVNVC